MLKTLTHAASDLGADARLPLLITLFCTICLFTNVQTANAHEGPPFPLIMDEVTGNYSISVWADPDVGEASFYVQIESSDSATVAIPEMVYMTVEPKSGRLEPVKVEGHQQRLRNKVQFEINPHFDQCDEWNLRFFVKQSAQTQEELAAVVESTPPGMGPWDLAIYLFPFAFIGMVWASFMIRRGRTVPHQPELDKRLHPSAPTHPESSSDRSQEFSSEANTTEQGVA